MEGSEHSAGLDTAFDPGTNDEDPAPCDPSSAEGQETSTAPFKASSYSSLDEVMAGAVPVQIPEDSRVPQELLLRVAWNIGLQGEEAVEETDPMVDTLAPEASPEWLCC